MLQNNEYDVIIIGGSYAGLSAAMALGRSLRNTLIIDAGDPCNRQTPYSHNFLTQDGRKPAEIAATAREQVAAYDTVHFCDGFVKSARRSGKRIEVSTSDERSFSARRIILATGVKDIMPAIPGFEACWGISAIHCPYCHGYEFKGESTAILANGAKALHLSQLVLNLTRRLTLLTNGPADFDEEAQKRLSEQGIKVVDSPISEITHENGHIQSLRFEDGSALAMQALYAALPFEQSSNIWQDLGCTLTESGHLQVDAFYKTSAEDVYACGDNAFGMRSVAHAVYSGNLVGAAVNMSLTAE